MGKEEPIAAPPRAYTLPRLSPDGARVALDVRDQEYDIWIWDLRRATLQRLTFEPGLDQGPLWTPDGRRIIFQSDRMGGTQNLWWQAADNTGAAERLTTGSNQQIPTGISPDGTEVVFSELTPTMGRDLMRLSLGGPRPAASSGPSTRSASSGSTVSTEPSTGSGRVTPLLQTKFEERGGIVSPDGRWLAYESDSSGRFEIYVRPFPDAGGGQSQVSTTGGMKPLWAPNGKELFFFGPDDALMRVAVEASAAVWNAGTPTKLLDGRYFTGGSTTSFRTYDVSPDGQRFLMIKTPGTDQTAAPPSVIVVQHWDEELKARVPAR